MVKGGCPKVLKGRGLLMIAVHSWIPSDAFFLFYACVLIYMWFVDFFFFSFILFSFYI